MRIVKALAVVGMVTALLTVDAWAQAQGRGRGGFSRYYQMSLLGIEKVQKELGLSDDQINSLFWIARGEQSRAPTTVGLSAYLYEDDPWRAAGVYKVRDSGYSLLYSVIKGHDRT